jgi:hypothetical protein
VNQASGDVEYGESSDPRYQQYNEQDHPDAHVASLSPSRARGRVGQSRKKYSPGLAELS